MEKLDSNVLEIILNNSADSIVVTDKNGIIKYVNPAFTKITGYSSQEVLGKTPSILKSGEHNDVFYENFWKDILNGTQVRVIFHNKNKFGEVYLHEEIITPIKENDEVTGFVSNGRDVTGLVKKTKDMEEFCKFIDTVFETLSTHMGVYKVMKDIKYSFKDLSCEKQK